MFNLTKKQVVLASGFGVAVYLTDLTRRNHKEKIRKRKIRTKDLVRWQNFERAMRVARRKMDSDPDIPFWDYSHILDREIVRQNYLYPVK